MNYTQLIFMTWACVGGFGLLIACAGLINCSTYMYEGLESVLLKISKVVMPVYVVLTILILALAISDLLTLAKVFR